MQIMEAAGVGHPFMPRVCWSKQQRGVTCTVIRCCRTLPQCDQAAPAASQQVAAVRAPHDIANRFLDRGLNGCAVQLDAASWHLQQVSWAAVKCRQQRSRFLQGELARSQAVS